MQTQQIIQASANVIRITKLVKGNIYKRFEDGSDRTYYGIVTDVLNDGINSIITATEYRKSWRDIEVEMKVIKGNKDVVLFPATIDELQMEFDSVGRMREDFVRQVLSLNTTHQLLSYHQQTMSVRAICYHHSFIAVSIVVKLLGK